MIRQFNYGTRLIILTGLFISCSPAGRISVTNINDAGFSQPASMIYSLPQTVIDVRITAEEIAVIPGPYRQYAYKYLGIQDAPEKPEYAWNITRVALLDHLETDPDYIYSIKGSYSSEAFPLVSALLSDSLILGTDYLQGYVFYNAFPVMRNELYFTDNSVKRNFEAEKDVEVSLVMPDTNYLNRPASKNALKEKTLEQKAEEAADFLIKLRKRRFKLVSGQYEAMPDGMALADALKELSRLEENYLSLFTGKRIINKQERTYHFTPASDMEDRTVLFRFSENEGFLGAGESRGKPVMIEFARGNKIKGLENSRLPEGEDNIIYYRVPDQVGVKLIIGETVLADASMPVFQSGTIVAIKMIPVSTKK
jgi:hypothetical protein